MKKCFFILFSLSKQHWVAEQREELRDGKKNVNWSLCDLHSWLVFTSFCIFMECESGSCAFEIAFESSVGNAIVASIFSHSIFEITHEIDRSSAVWMAKRANTVNCSRRAWASNCSSNNLDVAKNLASRYVTFFDFSCTLKTALSTFDDDSNDSQVLNWTHKTTCCDDDVSHIHIRVMFVMRCYGFWDRSRRARDDEWEINQIEHERTLEIFFNDSRVFRPPCVSRECAHNICEKFPSSMRCVLCCI